MSSRVRSVSTVELLPTKPAASLVALSVLILMGAFPGRAWGGKVNLARRYRPGQRMVYQTKIETRAKIRSNPPGLEAFLPPLPTEMVSKQQVTVTVQAVHGDGSVDVESRFDRFEFQSNLLDRLPENLRESTRRAQQEFVQAIGGHTLTAHYDREGKLAGFEGAHDLLQQLDDPLREPFRQLLKLFLEQVGGSTVDPGHAVKPGEEWKRQLTAPPFGPYPFSVDGESTLRYSGKIKVHGVKAAIVDFHFDNVLTPALQRPGQAGPLAQIEARGIKLDIRVDGSGSGRALLALDDGRVLQNRATVRQTLSARLSGPPGMPSPAPGPLTLDIDTETILEEDELGR